MNNININNINYLTSIADILAVPFFFLLSYYFYLKKNKIIFKKILFLFALSGLIVDCCLSIFKLFFSRTFM